VEIAMHCNLRAARRHAPDPGPVATLCTNASACTAVTWLLLSKQGRLASYTQQLHTCSISVNHRPNFNPNRNPTYMYT